MSRLHEITSTLQRTLQEQAGELQAMRLVMNQYKAEKEKEAASRAESRRVSPSSSHVIIFREKPATSPRSSSFMQGVSDRVHQATSMIAHVTTKLVTPALFNSRTVSPKGGKDKESTPYTTHENTNNGLDGVVVGTHVQSRRASQENGIFSPHLRIVLPSNGMNNQEEVKEEPSAPQLPISYPTRVLGNQPMPNPTNTGVPERKGNEHVRVSTPHTHAHISHAPARHTPIITPATKLEAPFYQHMPTTYNGKVGSKTHAAPLSETNLKIHTANSQTQAQHFNNPMHNTHEPRFSEPSPKTPANQGYRQPIGGTNDSFYDNHTPRTDQSLWGDDYSPLAQIPKINTQASRISNHHRYQGYYDQDDAQSEAYSEAKIARVAKRPGNQTKPKQEAPKYHASQEHQEPNKAHSERSGRRQTQRPEPRQEESEKEKSKREKPKKEKVKKEKDKKDEPKKEEPTKKAPKKTSKKPSSNKGKVGGGGDGSDGSDGSSSDGSSSNGGGGGGSNGGPSGDESDKASKTSTNVTTTSSKRKGKHTFPNQVMKTMTLQSNAIFAMCNTMNNLNSNKTSRPEKFAVNYSLQLKQVKLSKGERITAAFVIKTLTAAKDIDIAANKAVSRTPQTDNEWQSFFKFHMAHMTDILHEEMSTIVQTYSFTDSHTFWTHVFKRVFPNEIAIDAFDKALSSYMIWNEPLGIERWEAITKTLLTHKVVMSGKVATEIPMYKAENFAQQLQRLVMACPEWYSAPLFREYVGVYAKIRKYRDEDKQVTSEMYDKANVKFLKLLKVQLNAFQGTTIFGQASSKDSKITENTTHAPQPNSYAPPTPPSIPIPQATYHTPVHQLNHVLKTETIPPTYTQVTQQGGQGYMGGQAPPAHSPAYVKPSIPSHKKPYPANFSATAPNGNPRSYKWWTTCKGPNGEAKACNDPAPPEAKGQGCEYYGDWLDVQGLCCYCKSAEHRIGTCERYRLAVARFPKKTFPIEPKTGQENPPAHVQ
jgi:hypothetical protein